MIIDKITLNNYKSYRGTHSVSLTPVSNKKPIILFGGLNGGGKTTLLEGIQLALYGKLAPFLTGLPYGYHEYLSRSINNDCNPKDGASVEMSFRSIEHGQEHQFHIVRSWSHTGKTVREHTDVYLDGSHEPVLSDTWLEQVERFIPVRLSHLFIFDGERIESLANIEQSASLLSNAINSLLGIDLVDRLIDDLQVIIKRKTKETAKPERNNKIADLESQCFLLDELVENNLRPKCRIEKTLRENEKEFQKFEKKFIKEGGQLGQQYEELKLKRGLIKTELLTLTEHLIEMASGALPLTLLRDTLFDINQQVTIEEQFSQALMLKDQIHLHGQRLLKWLKKKKLSSDVLESITAFIEEEKKKLVLENSPQNYLELTHHGKTQLLSMATILNDQIKRSTGLLDGYRKSHESLSAVDRMLALTPDEKTLKELTEELKARQSEIEKNKSELAKLENELLVTRAKREEVKAKLENEYRTVRELDIENEDVFRTITHSERAKTTLKSFHSEILSKNIDRLQKYILESYLSLLRKKTLVSRLTINPNTFELTLFNHANKDVQPGQLSAGERQLLAASMLWSLGKASGRPLPVVIDTPLGRLDGSHRKHLVERYFPQASHQVILLSTDEEIDKKHYENLKPHISHTYHIQYQDEDRCSKIDTGYFWD